MIWLILAVACVLGAFVAWALCARTGQLDDAAGVGDTRHPFFDRCEHGVQFLNECEDCPDRCPQIAAAPADDIVTGCTLCPPSAPHVPDEALVDHVRLLHPDAWGDGPELWPDGEVVVADLTLEPDDFGGER